MNNINDIRKNWHTLVENFRSNGTINELEFKDKDAFNAYADQHDISPDTDVTVDGKPMKAGDVNKQQDEPAEPESNIDFTADAEKEAEGGSKTDVRGFELANFDDASKGQKAIIDLELLNNWSRYKGDDARSAQEFADEMMNLWSADEVQNYMKDNGWSENDAKVFAQTFADAEGTGTDEPTEPTDVYDNPADTGAVEDEYGDDAAVDDDWYSDDPDAPEPFYGDDDQFDMGPGQEAEEIDKYATELADMFDDSDNIYDSIEDMLRSGAELPDGMDRAFIEDYIDDIADQAEEQKKQKFNKDTFGESFTNPFENKLLKSIIKGKK